MNHEPLRTIWWSLMASVKGMSYLEYLEYKKAKCEKQIEELPDINNFLSVLLEYYSFKSVKRSLEVLVFIAGISLIIYVICEQFKVDFLSGFLGFLIPQSLMFIAGFYLKYKCKNNIS
jgi:uncharacterized membrane protein